ncbi:MAG: hypothetical protein LLG04_02755 [Parachlamydia sp.]|nr:hypothetical protein [Parachlamydia sp.]
MDPAHYLNGLLPLQPLTLELICRSGQNLKEGVRRLQATFGESNQQKVSEKLIGAAKAKYDKVQQKERSKFLEVCTHYAQSLIRQEPFQPVSGSPLQHARKLDSLDLTSTPIVTIKRYLPCTPMPEKYILDYRLNQIMLVERMEGNARMRDFCGKVVAGRIAAMAFLYRFGKAKHSETITMHAEELLSFEIRWNCHTPLPNQSCITLLKSWAKKGECQERIVSRLFQRLALTPLIQVTDPNRNQLTQVFTLICSDMQLQDTESFAFHIATCTMEYAFDQLFQQDAKGSHRLAFARKYAFECLDPAIQSKTVIAILEITGDYPKTARFEGMMHLEIVKTQIDDLFNEYAERPAGHRLACSLMLLTHLAKLVPFELEEKIALFEGLDTLDPQGRETIFDFFMRKIDREKHAAILTLVNERETLFELNLADKVRLYLFLLRLACNSSITLGESRYLENLHELRWPRELVSILLEAQFVDPCLLDFCRVCSSCGKDWFEPLIALLRLYTPWNEKVQNSHQYNQSVLRLQNARDTLEHAFRVADSKPDLYHKLMSWILACHMEQLQATSPEEKRGWLQAFCKMQPDQRMKLAEALVRPQYDWQKRDHQDLPLQQVWNDYTFTEDEKAFLMVRQALDKKNLRPNPFPLLLTRHVEPLTFYEAFQLLRDVERRARVSIPKEMAFISLERLFFPRKLKELFEQRDKLASEIRLRHSRVFFPSELIKTLIDCETALFGLGVGDEIVALGHWNKETMDIFLFVVNAVNQALLPTGIHHFYQRLFMRHLQVVGDIVKEKKKRWVDVHRCELTSLQHPEGRAILVEDREDDHGLYLIIRLVESRLKLQTRSVKVALSKRLPHNERPMLANPAFVELAFDLCQLMCDERQVVPDLSPEPEHTLLLLENAMQEAPELAERVVAFRNEDPSHDRMLLLLLQVLIGLKQGVRIGFWDLAQPKPASPSRDLVAYAAKGNVWNLEGGFSLLPSLSPCFLVLFEQYRSAILHLHEDFAKTHNCSHEALFELELQGARGVEKHGVHVSVNYCRRACVESYDEVCEVTPEEEVVYHEVQLSVQNHPHIYVMERFFESLSPGEAVTRISWMLALLKSEWYSKRGR